jgi:hypothetical protein
MKTVEGILESVIKENGYLFGIDNCYRKIALKTAEYYISQYKSIIQKQEELIEHWKEKDCWTYANPDWDKWNDRLIQLNNELAKLKEG